MVLSAIAAACRAPSRDESAAPASVSRSAHALLSDGLVAHYRFDESAGTVATDASGNGNHATLNGDARWSAAGRVAWAAQVAGGGYLHAAPSATLNASTTAVTIAGWFRRERNPASGDQYLVYRRNRAASTVVHVLQGAGGDVCFAVLGQQTCAGSLPPGDWHHVAGTWDGVTTRLYVGGVLRATGAVTGTLAFDAGFGLHLGASQDGAFAYDGLLDEWRIWARALRGDEVWKLAHPEAVDCELAVAGTACDDDDPCTQGETCRAGTCSASGAVPVRCDSANRCPCATERRAVLVVGALPLSPGDALLASRLRATGHGVFAVRDLDVRPSHALGKAVVVLSETVTSGNVTPTLLGVATPIVALEPGLFDDLGMTGTIYGTDFGDAAGATTIRIADPGHRLAAGYTGTVTIASTGQAVGWGRPARSALTVASLVEDPSRATIFAYHAGAQMARGTAPARRVAFFARGLVPAALAPSGWALFDAAVAWATGESPSALLVVGAQSPTGDAALRARLQDALGFDVQQVDQTQATAEHALPHRMIVISETVSSSVIGARYATIAKPVLALEGGIWGPMGMTGAAWNGDWGALETSAGQVVIDVSRDGHPLSGGLSGAVVIGTAPLKFMWGVPAPSAIRVASLPGEPARVAVFAYRARAAMASGVAPARRVGFFAGDVTPARLNAEGWRLFDAAVRWLLLPEQTATLVVADPASLNASDRALRARLQGLDYEVALSAGPTVQPEDLTGVRVVVISESVLSATVGTRLTRVAVPLVSLEPALFDELGMTGATWQVHQGDAPAQTQVTIVDGTHPLAAGVSPGELTVTSAPSKFVWGVPALMPTVQAQRVATIPGQPERLAIFAYEAGARMVTGVAPARRVGWFIGDPFAQSLNASGWRLFDAAIRWAVATPGQCEGRPDGEACEDGSACTVADRCRAGTCQGEPRHCEDGNPCTVNACLPEAGCTTSTAGTDGLACDDGDACTVADACRAGTCIGAQATSLCALAPHVACVEPGSPDGSASVAHLGYMNPSAEPVTVPVGSPGNRLLPAPIRGDLPATFLPGAHEDAFRITYTGASLAWTLGGRTVVASPASPRCCAGAPPAGTGAPSTTDVRFRENWEACHPAGAWRDGTGNEAVYASAVTSPPVAGAGTRLAEWSACRGDSGRVQVLTGLAGTAPVRSSWFSLIPVAPGETYCLSVWVDWVGGGSPYIDLLPYDRAMTPLGGRQRLIGAAAPHAGNLAQETLPTPVSSDPGFRRYRKAFSVSPGVGFIQLETGVLPAGGAVPSKPAPELVYVDDVTISLGTCSL